VSVQETLGIKLYVNDDISAWKPLGNLGKDAIWQRLWICGIDFHMGMQPRPFVTDQGTLQQLDLLAGRAR
jgi:hypothetical protein